MDEKLSLNDALRMDGVARNEEHPDTFHIPSAEIRMHLKPGHSVKIGLEDSEGYGERFWVQLTTVFNEGTENVWYVGTVDNDLEFFDLPHGTPIPFEPRHALMVL